MNKLDLELLKDWRGQIEAAPPPPEVPYPEEHWDWTGYICTPLIDPTAWVAPGAVVMGRVRLKARSSVWYNCTVRGDQDYLELGEESNLQDNSVMHMDCGYPCILGNRVSVGHGAIIHGSIVEDGALIGIGATVLSRCVIGTGALIAAGAVVMEGTRVPPHTLWAGVPAKQLKDLTPEQRERLAATYRHYVNNATACLARFGRGHIEALLAGCQVAPPATGF
jgi:carbonic anhydrase/acetyltransferase-like protein (isoleucine patch superfamily)